MLEGTKTTQGRFLEYLWKFQPEYLNLIIVVRGVNTYTAISIMYL